MCTARRRKSDTRGCLGGRRRGCDKCKQERERQLALYEEPGFRVGLAKHYIIEALEREVDQVGRELLREALGELGEAQRIWAAWVAYPYARRER